MTARTLGWYPPRCRGASTGRLCANFHTACSLLPELVVGGGWTRHIRCASVLNNGDLMTIRQSIPGESRLFRHLGGTHGHLVAATR